MSQINENNINGNYPVAGQDNDSQGFRDNFTNVRNNLKIARTELEDLQAKVLLKEPLSGELATDSAFNNLNGSVLSNAVLKSWGNTSALKSGSTIDLDFSEGNAFIVTVNQNVTVTLSNFPNSSFVSVKVVLDVDNARVVTLPSGLEGSADLQGYNAVDNSIEFDSAGVYIYELSSYDGNTFYINDLSRARKSFTSVTISDVLTLEPLDSAPASPSIGTIVVANPIWDPAGLSGTVPYPVFYNGTGWVSMV